MKAIVYTEYGAPDVLQLQEVATPAPMDNELLIKIHAAAVNAADTVNRKGEPFIARSATGFIKPKNNIPGDMLAGEIVAVGKAVTLFKPGDQVFGSAGTGLGAHAEYITLPETGALALKPANMSYEEAATICDGALTALTFLRHKAHVQPGQRVLINGASGSVGTAAVQLAKSFGAEVSGVCSTRNLELVKSLGADQVIDYTQEDFTKTGQHYDIIFDTVGNVSFSRCKNSLTDGGIFLTTILSSAIVLHMLWTSMFGRKKAIFAAAGLGPASEKAKDLTFLKELIEAGRLKSVIDRRYPLAEIAVAHSYVDTGHKRGNVAITIS